MINISSSVIFFFFFREIQFFVEMNSYVLRTKIDILLLERVIEIKLRGLCCAFLSIDPLKIENKGWKMKGIFILILTTIVSDFFLFFDKKIHKFFRKNTLVTVSSFIFIFP